MKAKKKIRKKKMNKFAKIRWMKSKIIITARTLQYILYILLQHVLYSVIAKAMENGKS